ncbi:uncharacterized protein ATC70_013237 [Mucor velutinosus]|uniref:Uncharacterized protein n=1 Tax=Mucor velutinosus TaxID=708070 RepID=A0AAN7D3K8_9FUNG|nr:hypothetical protein ATC70_013237 [Mucor velutinosus]
MSDNRRNKRRRKIKDGRLNTEPKQHSLKYQNQKIREQQKFVKQYTAHRNDTVCAVPAQHPGPSSSAERTQRAAVIYPSNDGVEDIDMGSQWQNIDDDDNTSLSSRYKRWQDVRDVLLKNFLESHEVHVHADPCLKKPITLGTKPTNCDFNTRQTSWPIHGFMMFAKGKVKSFKNAKIDYIEYKALCFPDGILYPPNIARVTVDVSNVANSTKETKVCSAFFAF